LKSNFTVKSILGVTALSAGLLLTSISANAAEFGVRVVDEAGMPVVGASVCFGLPGSYSQFGTGFTDEQGQATADVPNIPFMVTVSKTRFSGVRIEEPGRGFNLVKQVTLVEGFPGPRCKAGSSIADANESLVRISDVDVAMQGNRTSLLPVATGEPNEYRVSASPDLSFQNWSVLGDSIRLSSTLAANSEVYLQLRRYEGVSNRWIDSQSEVSKVYLPKADSNL